MIKKTVYESLRRDPQGVYVKLLRNVYQLIKKRAYEPLRQDSRPFHVKLIRSQLSNP